MAARAKTMEVRKGRGVGPNMDHVYPHLDHVPPGTLAVRAPDIPEKSKMCVGVGGTNS